MVEHVFEVTVPLPFFVELAPSRLVMDFFGHFSVPFHVEALESWELNLFNDWLGANHEDDSTIGAEMFKSSVPAVSLVGNPETKPGATWKRCDREFRLTWDGGNEVIAVTAGQVLDWASLQSFQGRTKLSQLWVDTLYAHHDNFFSWVWLQALIGMWCHGSVDLSVKHGYHRTHV